MKGSVPIYKLYVKCSEPRRLCKPIFGQTCFLAPYLIELDKYKNVIKNNITRLVLHIIVCLSKIE